MKLGLSLLLGEYVDASRLEHADTAGFQVVCPCCRESVFKVQRPRADGEVSHFLSHRHADRTRTAECEMRVAAILHEARTAFNAASRGQTIARFLGILRQAVSLDMAPYAGTTVEKAHWRLSSSHVWKALSPALAPSTRLWNDERGTEGLLSLYEWLFLECTGRRLSTPLALEVQGEIAREVQIHLTTTHASSNHDFLLRHSMIRVLGSAARYREVVPSGIARASFDSRNVERRLHQITRERIALEGELAALGATVEPWESDTAGYESRHAENRDWHRERLQEMAASVDRVVPLISIRSEGEGRRAMEGLMRDEHLLAVFVYAVQMEYLGTLLRLPYLRMAENHAAGRPVLEGIKPAMDADFGATAMPGAASA